MSDVIPILYNFWQARKLMSHLKTKDDVRLWQARRISKFINTTLQESPFYKPYIGKSLYDFPIINKSVMMQEFNSINTAGITLSEASEVARKAEESRNFMPMIGKITVGLSSGTSGKHGIFLASKAERQKWAGIMLAKALPGSIFRKYKIAFFLRANSNLYTTLSKSNCITFNFFDLTKPFEDSLKELTALNPDILTAPAHVLKLIATAQENNMVSINPIKIFSVAEVLDPSDEKYIESVFCQKIYQIYQCTEGFLGITNNDGKFYLNEEYIHVEKEWIDKASGRFIPIITDFSRTTQPVVRYKLDDVLIEDNSDNSPFTCLKFIEGRYDDICYFESHNGTLVPMFADVLRQVLATSEVSFDEYKIIQHHPSSLEIQLKPEPSENIKLSLKRDFDLLCKNYKYKTPAISFSVYTHNPLHQKLKRIESRYKITQNSLIGE